MAISNYTELKAAVSAWMHRDDLSSYVADFIQQGEAMLNRRLRTVDMENIATLTADTASRFLALPTGFVEMLSLWCDDPREEIHYITPGEMASAVVTTSGLPELFTLKSNIEFDRLPDSAYSLECRYFKKYDIANDTTNTLLTNHPEIYLHAALAAASVYVIDDQRLAAFKSLVSEEIEELNNAEERKRGSSLGILRTELATTGFDIIHGE